MANLRGITKMNSQCVRLIISTINKVEQDRAEVVKAIGLHATGNYNDATDIAQRFIKEHQGDISYLRGAEESIQSIAGYSYKRY